MMIGDKIKTLRKAKKLTQEQLAEYLHLSAQAVSKWETGASAPDIDMLPRLAVFFQVSIDELMDFDRRRIDAEVEALVEQSVPLRANPGQAEAFYREALRQYPNNEVLLNCLLMVIPNERSAEKLEIGERLLDCTSDDEIKYDVLRLMALTCRHTGERAMAEHYLAQIPELYFLKTELAAFLREGDAQLDEIRKTEGVCLATLTAMLALRAQREKIELDREQYRALAHDLLDLFREHDGQREHTERLKSGFDDGSIFNFYR